MSKAQPYTDTSPLPGTWAGPDWETALELIRNSNHILLISHVSPDGDAIGSLLGLGLGLETIGKTPTLACENPVPPKFHFLPRWETIVDRIDAIPVDLIIGLDCSDMARFGDVYDADRLSGLPLINIDHHVTNVHFGDVNLVDPEAASTAELVLQLLDHLGVAIDNQDGEYVATCLLTGIVTDTLGFRTSNVSPRVMKAAMRLIKAGASLPEIIHHTFHQRPVIELALLARGLDRMQTQDGLGWSEIRLSDRRACGYKGDGDAGLVGMLVRTREVLISAVFAEKEEDQVEISFRADPGFDVAQLALSLGGGGHPAASGCTVDGSLEQAKARVLPMLRAILDEQRGQLSKDR